MRPEEKVLLPFIAMQATTVAFLWSLDALSQVSQAIFTLFLAADLLSFAVVSHVYRVLGQGYSVGMGWLAASGLIIFALIVAALFVS